MIRKAAVQDLHTIMDIIKETIKEMKQYGNTQWDENYPRERDFFHDIQAGELYVIERDECLAGFVCLNTTEPAEYTALPWSQTEPAIVIHRMAVNPSYRRQGIGTMLMQFAQDVALDNHITYLKTDTYSVNANMNTLFQKCGYQLVGSMRFLGKENPFYCYEKILE